MSTIVTNTITGLSTAANITIGSTPVVSASANSLTIRGEGSAQTSVQQGLTKVWCRFNGTGTVAINDSFNTTSITDHSTGLYTVTYANDMATANHSPHVTSGVNGATWGLQQNDTIAAGSHKFLLMTPDATATDNSVVPTSSNGDLA